MLQQKGWAKARRLLKAPPPAKAGGISKDGVVVKAELRLSAPGGELKISIC